MASRFSRAVLLLLLFALPFAARVQADPVTVDSGISRFSANDGPGAPAFTGNLAGSGTVTFTIFPGEAGEYNFADLLYSFDTVNPVREPGTIALIGSGLAGLFLRHRRRLA